MNKDPAHRTYKSLYNINMSIQIVMLYLTKWSAILKRKNTILHFKSMKSFKKD